MIDQIHVLSDLPTIYADMNIYRYVAYGDISIDSPERFRWVYSYVHLNEIVKNGNTDALEGMRALKAVEVCDVLNDTFQSTGQIKLCEYVDPIERYHEHVEAISGYESYTDMMEEYLLRSFGADNFSELSATPERLFAAVDQSTHDLPADQRDELIERAKRASDNMRDHINDDLKETRSLAEFRDHVGASSDARGKAIKSDAPIDELWEIIGPNLSDKIDLNQFIGLEPYPGTEGSDHRQDTRLVGMHIALNMLGLSPDRGLTKRDKIKSIMSDGQHVGMASYCNGLLSADRRFCDKARAIYTHVKFDTDVLWIQFKKGCVIRIDAE